MEICLPLPPPTTHTHTHCRTPPSAPLTRCSVLVYKWKAIPSSPPSPRSAVFHSLDCQSVDIFLCDLDLRSSDVLPSQLIYVISRYPRLRFSLSRCKDRKTRFLSTLGLLFSLAGLSSVNIVKASFCTGVNQRFSLAVLLKY